MQHGFILEDLPESQVWLRQALSSSFPGIAIVVAETLQEAGSLLRNGPAPDIALIDLGLPDGSGVEIIELTQRLSPPTLCIVTSIYDDDGHVFPALRAGAQGYLLKDQPIDSIVQALQGIAAGEPPLSPAIARRMLTFFNRASVASTSALTVRETEVLRFIAKGMTQAETARLLGISQHTVSGYVKDLYRKLNVSSRAEAALLARDMGLV
ncbi:DNA-binding response regulator [Denitratisoma sp. DHT3]|uniref:LuxR C-terminal-related transcriptional regulator n=1 Tax=Denitratisoma sp. DHT3 TaxID=1981880 RepID=UPI00119854E8|nr:response regulator transcription factor [Denitratisoma sp. DHT3]QDX82316.1 DNA-binding response regulator [Denitratisoma sp. DHT3]